MTAHDISDMMAGVIVPGITLATLIRNRILSVNHPNDSSDTGFALKRMVACALLYFFDYWYYCNDFYHFSNNNPFLALIIIGMYSQLVVTIGKVFIESFEYKGYRSMGIGFSDCLSAFIWKLVGPKFSCKIPHREFGKNKRDKYGETWEEKHQRWQREAEAYEKREKEKAEFNQWWHDQFGEWYYDKNGVHTEKNYTKSAGHNTQNGGSFKKSSSYQQNTNNTNENNRAGTSENQVYTAKEREAIRMLGLKDGFTKKDIHDRRIYFAKQYHPDISGARSYEDKMAAINNACDILEHCAIAN